MHSRSRFFLDFLFKKKSLMVVVTYMKYNGIEWNNKPFLTYD